MYNKIIIIIVTNRFPTGSVHWPQDFFHYHHIVGVRVAFVSITQVIHNTTHLYWYGTQQVLRYLPSKNENSAKFKPTLSAAGFANADADKILLIPMRCGNLLIDVLLRTPRRIFSSHILKGNYNTTVWRYSRGVDAPREEPLLMEYLIPTIF